MNLDELHKDAPPLSLTSTQEEWDAWFGYYTDHTREAAGDAGNDFLYIDLNDAVMNYITLNELVKRHPELGDRAKEIVEDVVRHAMGEEGGMAGGAGYIAKELGADREEAMQIMFRDIFAKMEGHD